MANPARTIKIVINLRQLEDGDGFGSGCASGCGGGGSASCCEDPPPPRRDPKVALEAARQLGRSCGGSGGCSEVKPKQACEQPKTECPASPPACPASPPTCEKKEPTPPLPPPICEKKEPTPAPPPPAPEPKSKCQQKKEVPPPPPPPSTCVKKEPSPPPPPPPPTCVKKEPSPPPPPPKKEACAAKKEPETPPKKPTCAKPILTCLVPEPKQCTPPKYPNTELRPDGKEQQCKEGSSTERKCRQLGQQRQRGDDYPNPASSGGMVQFFKDRIYDATGRW